jgi:copper chaperone CopZ
MMCEHCVKRVKKALESLDGVNSCEVSLEKNNAIIMVSKDISNKYLKDSIKKEGYKVTKIIK